MPCPACGCTHADGAGAHALVAALGSDDIDRALALGLLDDGIACSACDVACSALLQAARIQRQDALAARERYRLRNERLQRRQRERAERRKPAPATAAATTTSTPALPAAAAAALARAKARAAGPKPS